MPLLLNGGALPTLVRCRAQYRNGDHLGRLARPRHIGQLRETCELGFKVGIDNEAYCNWNAQRFAAMIGHIEVALYGRILTQMQRLSALTTSRTDATALGAPPIPNLPAWVTNILFLTVPDVPFDARATARRWQEWAPLISHLPLALCLQDGVEDLGIPWGWPGLRCLFMAGSTRYKLSDTMADICREGKRRGLWIHAGRINSRCRIRYMRALDVVDSIDGSSFDQYRDSHIGWGLDEVAALETQQLLPFPRN